MDEARRSEQSVKDHTIRLQFTSQAAIESYLIAWFSHGGGFSHVDAVRGTSLYGARSDRIQIGSKVYPSGVHLRPAGYAKFTRCVIFELKVTAQQHTAFWNFLDEQNGKPYDWLGIFGVVSDRDLEDPDRWFCSRLIFAALLWARIIPSTEYIPDGLITPRDVAFAISILGGRVVV